MITELHNTIHQQTVILTHHSTAHAITKITHAHFTAYKYKKKHRRLKTLLQNS